MLLHRCIKLINSVCRDAVNFHSIVYKTQTNERKWLLLKGRSCSSLWVVWWHHVRVICVLNTFLTKIYCTRQWLRIWNILSLGHLRISPHRMSSILLCWSKYEENDIINKLSRFWFEEKATLILSCSMRLIFICFPSFSHTLHFPVFDILIWNTTQTRRQNLTSLVLVQFQQHCMRKIWSNDSEILSLNGSLPCSTFASCSHFC